MIVNTKTSAVAVAALAAVLSRPASADLILDSTIMMNGTGFGAVPTLVTVQGTGTESGCISFGSSAPCATGTGLVGGDNTGLNGFRTAADLPGISNAGQLALVVNINEPGNDTTATLTGLYLSIYSQSGTLLGLHQYTGPDVVLRAKPGTGSAGTVFTLSSSGQARATSQCPNIAECLFGGGVEFRAGTARGGPESVFLSFIGDNGALPEASGILAGAAQGPFGSTATSSGDPASTATSFLANNGVPLAPAAVPEPGKLGVLGLVLLALTRLLQRRRVRTGVRA
jgi:hypothetical protein